MAKSSRGTRTVTPTSASSPAAGSSGGVTQGAGKLIAAVQSGKYDKLSYAEQDELYNDAAYESKTLNVKPAEERYNAEQMKALAVYHSSLYDDINSDLRRGGNGGQYAKTLDGMFDYTLKKPVVVYRGTEKAPARGADKAFQSTSLSAAKAQYFTHGSKHLHAYKLPAGTKVIYLGGSEEEIILPRGFNLAKHKIK